MTTIAKQWMSSKTLVARGMHGQLAMVDGDALKRRDVVSNAKLLIPVIAELGLRPTVDQIEEHVMIFFEMARPKGKPRLTRPFESKYKLYMFW